MIKLKVKNTDNDVREFTKEHAIAVLNLKKTQFELPLDSDYELVENELRIKSDKGANTKKPGKRKPARGSSTGS